MNKKYQKPVSRNLGDLAVAEGSCGYGFGVRVSDCSIGSNHYLCNIGGNFHLVSCNDGASATSLCNVGMSAH